MHLRLMVSPTVQFSREKYVHQTQASKLSQKSKTRRAHSTYTSIIHHTFAIHAHISVSLIANVHKNQHIQSQTQIFDDFFVFLVFSVDTRKVYLSNFHPYFSIKLLIREFLNCFCQSLCQQSAIWLSMLRAAGARRNEEKKSYVDWMQLVKTVRTTHCSVCTHSNR